MPTPLDELPFPVRCGYPGCNTGPFYGAIEVDEHITEERLKTMQRTLSLSLRPLNPDYPGVHPIPLPEISQADIKRFWAHVKVGRRDECWPYDSPQYGCFWAAGKTLSSSRVAYFLQYGKDPFPFLVCHTCDNPPCCNGRHLFPGTYLENNRDRKCKGRSAGGKRHWSNLHPERLARGDRNGSRKHPERLMRGEKIATSKLTERDVRKIRKDPRGIRVIARHYKVSDNTIYFIKTFKTWRHLRAECPEF